MNLDDVVPGVGDEPLPFGSWNVAEIARRLDRPTWRDRLRYDNLKPTAARVLRQLWYAGDEIMNRLVTAEGAIEIMREEHRRKISEMNADQAQAVAAAKRDMEATAGRIDMAIDDFQRSQATVSWSRREEPFGIILSPYQFERMRWASGFTKGGDDGERQVRLYRNMPIYTAKGLSGPLVVSKSAFDGLTRQAPELNLVSK